MQGPLIGFGVPSDILVGLINLSLGFSSVGFY
jgi:hypothetical protein